MSSAPPAKTVIDQQNIDVNTIQVSKIQWENNDSLVAAATQGNVDLVRFWIGVANPSADDFLPFFRAISNGHTECVKLLLPVSNITDNLEKALETAARGQQPEVLELLLDYRTPTTDIHNALMVCADNNNCACLTLLLPYSTLKNNNMALHAAAYNRSVQAFELLLPVSDPQVDGGLILSVASSLPLPLFQQLIDCIPHPDYATIHNALLRSVNSGDKEKVQALLPKVDVMYREGRALCTALKYDDHAMAELLYEGSDLTAVLDVLRKDPDIKDFQIQRLIELEEAQRQNALLKEVVDGVCTTTKARKM